MTQPPVTLLWRLGVSLLVGLFVAAVAWWTGYGQYAGSSVVRAPHRTTMHFIREACREVDAYRDEHQALPRRLTDISAPLHGLDGWRHPLQYWTDGTRYRVTSYGRDGRPGGRGWDYDLSSDDLPAYARGGRLPRGAAVTVAQFRKGDEAPRMLLAAALAGVLAFALSLTLSRRTAPTPLGLGGLLVKLLLTTFAALFVGSIMTALHVPSGH